MFHRLVYLSILLASVGLAISDNATVGNKEAADFDLQLHRLKNAIHPYRNEIKSTWSRQIVSVQQDSGGAFSCGLCNSVMPILRGWARQYEKKKIQEIVIEACKALGLAPRPDICEPIIKSYTDQFLYIITNTTNTDDPLYAAQLCGVLTTNCPHAAIINITVNIAGKKPELTDRKILSASDPSTTKIIQFTDLHVDLDYSSGTLKNCGEGMPICCRQEYGIPENVSLRSGAFGEFSCALPINTAKIMMNHAKKNNPDARYVFLTGDYIHSGVWKYNQAENQRHVEAVTQTLVEVFDDPKIKIFPLTGNHEAHVVNMYPPEDLWNVPGFNISWLYTTLMKPFITRDPNFLPEAELERFYKKGWYTVSPEAGLRLIILNTNLCYSQNFWVGYSPYPIVTEQLQWLSNELDKAEKAKENVLIIGHVEPGNCWPAWSGKFHEIMERYEGILRGSFFGHSHTPQYRVSLSKDDMRPIFASYIAGSMLSDSMHPAYSVFHADGERGAESQWDILRQEVTILHLGESNTGGEAVFKTVGDSYETFKMDNLSPKSVLDLGNRLMCDQKLLDLYQIFRSKGEDSANHKKCKNNNLGCMNDILCNVVSSNAEDNRGCQDFQKRFRAMTCEGSGTATFTSSQALVTGLIFTVLLKLNIW